MDGRHEVAEGPRLADDRRQLHAGCCHHPHVVLAEAPCLGGLDYQHPLEDAAIDHRHAQEGRVGILAGLVEVLEPRMLRRVLDHERTYLLSDETGQPLSDAHPHTADALGTQPDRRCQHQRRAIRLQQIHGADVGDDPLLDQRHDIGERFRRIAASGDEVTDLFEGPQQ
jgi:hypothetical protein